MRTIPLPAILLLLAGAVHSQDAAAGTGPSISPATYVRRSAIPLPQGDIHSFEADEPPGAGSSARAEGHPRNDPSTVATKTAPAPGGGLGQVWVNASLKAYHCQGTPYYGRTRHGEYMTEAAAKAAGAHPAGGRPCP